MAAGRYFIGIGVGEYDDPSLNLPRALEDVVRVQKWFVEDCGEAHRHELEALGENPTWEAIVRDLSSFLGRCGEDDVVVVWFACHGELQGDKGYLFGRNTPRQRLAGNAVGAATIGEIVGQSKPHNVLLIIDACVAGVLGGVIQRAAEDMAVQENTRRPQLAHAQAVIASTYARDLAEDGSFADAFLRVVGQERWTGTTSRWVTIDQLISGLNQELRLIAPAQVADRRVWGPGAAELLPNPHFDRRRLFGLIADQELAVHFDTASRGVLAGENGTYFTGRERELAECVRWLTAEDRAVTPSMMVITGSPGAGKSSLLARLVVLADPALRVEALGDSQPPRSAVPPQGAFDGVIWCHNKTFRQVVDELAAIFGGTAQDVPGLLELAVHRSFTVAVDSLDEASGEDAARLAAEVFRKLAEDGGVRVLVATRRHAVHGLPGRSDLPALLSPTRQGIVDLDESPSGDDDIRAYVLRRLSAAGVEQDRSRRLAGEIAAAAGVSFLVAALATRTATLRSAEGEQYTLPSSVGGALAAYIERLPNPRKARDILRPLAWARGGGLPWGSLWPVLATALAGVVDPDGVAPGYADGDVADVLDAGGDLVVEAAIRARPSYRLFHEALAEHFRKECDPAQASAVIAATMLAEVGNRSWSLADPYVAEHLPAYLRGAGRLDEAVDLLLDPGWERALRERSVDPLAPVADVERMVTTLLDVEPAGLRVVELCHVYSQATSSAHPAVIDVLAQSGQSSRAIAMANNVTAANDRLFAFQLLAQSFAAQGNHAAARSSVQQVEMAVAAMPPAHRPMAWHRVAKAAFAAGLEPRAAQAARNALKAALTLEGDGWDVPNGLFWAGSAARIVRDEDASARVRAELDSGLNPAFRFRNQALQAAAVSGHWAFLRDRLEEWRLSRYPTGPIRDGNIGLALADCGMFDELDEVIATVLHSPRDEDLDARKRWAWALAFRGRMDDAIGVIGTIHDAIEGMKAVARVAEVAHDRRDTAALGKLADLAHRYRGGSSRTRARIVRVWWQAGRAEDALALAEKEITRAHDRSPLVDPREAGELTAKAGRREMVTSVVPVEDDRRCQSVAEHAKAGDFDRAKEVAEQITVPIFRARAFEALARTDPVPEKRLRAWLRALHSARAVGRDEVVKLEALGSEILDAAGRSADFAEMKARLVELDVRWEIERFAEQYATLRRVLRPGAERTEKMTSLLLAARVSSQAGSWRREDLERVWASGDEGRRLLALSVIQGAPQLAVPEILVEGIRGSRSAFEQYHALQAALACDLTGEAARVVHEAVVDELAGVRRSDGSPARVGRRTDRARLATRLLARLG